MMAFIILVSLKHMKLSAQSRLHFGCKVDWTGLLAHKASSSAARSLIRAASIGQALPGS